MAGADRIEGTLLGNGERTGNMDILVMAMNLYTQGIDPELDLSQVSDIVQIVSECNNLPVHPRHPYVGELVFTAFSGSHQDAIKKSLDYNEKHPETQQHWDVAYLPIDPIHIGRGYQDVVRINSQSGKGGAAYILQRHFGFNLPRWTQIDFARVVQAYAESMARELKTDELLEIFTQAYLKQDKFRLSDYTISNKGDAVSFQGQVVTPKAVFEVIGQGNGALSAFIDGLVKSTGRQIHVTNYAEHAIDSKTHQKTDTDNQTDAAAAAYIQLSVEGQIYSGIATCHSTVSAMLKGALSALAQAW